MRGQAPGTLFALFTGTPGMFTLEEYIHRLKVKGVSFDILFHWECND